MSNGNGRREPLTFWQTVGANMVGGLVMGGVSMLAAFTVAAIAARGATRDALQQLRQEGVLPPVAEG